MGKRKIFTKNKFGISICKCCASCMKKSFDKRLRLCTVGEGLVLPSHVCKKWVMSPYLENVGRGTGYVKRKDYLLFALDRLMENGTAGRPVANIDSVGEVRSEFTRIHGDIYEITE